MGALWATLGDFESHLVSRLVFELKNSKLQVAPILFVSGFDAMLDSWILCGTAFCFADPVGGSDNCFGVLLRVTDFAFSILGNFGNDAVISFAADLGADSIVQVTFGEETQFGLSGDSDRVGGISFSIGIEGLDDCILVFAIFVEMSGIFEVGDLFGALASAHSVWGCRVAAICHQASVRPGFLDIPGF
jgi:hypothetical protein